MMPQVLAAAACECARMCMRCLRGLSIAGRILLAYAPKRQMLPAGITSSHQPACPH